MRPPAISSGCIRIRLARGAALLRRVNRGVAILGDTLFMRPSMRTCGGQCAQRRVGRGRQSPSFRLWARHGWQRWRQRQRVGRIGDEDHP